MSTRENVRLIARAPLIFLFLNKSICCGYSKDGSLEYPKCMLKFMGEKI